ncbi:MAG: HAD family hydrolase [Alphaproteobacteria bacterium]
MSLNRPHNLKAVFFDMDGTLIDSEGVHFQNIVAVCREYGYEFTQEDDERFMGFSMTDIFNAIKPYFSRPITFYDFYEGNVQRFAQVISREHLFVGVEEALQYLKSKQIPMYVVTNGEQKSADIALEKTAIRHYFVDVITAAQVQNPKPHPEPYLKAAAAANIPIEQCLIIEDSVTGTRSAVDAGGYVMALTHSQAASKLKLAHEIMTEFSKIPFKTIF